MCEIKEIKTKVCSKCKIEKNYSKFYKDSSRVNGIRYNCKRCCNEYIFEYVLKNKDKIKECRKTYNKTHRLNNKVKIKEYRKKYYENNEENAKKYSLGISMNLTDSYVINSLRMKSCDVTHELIELKRVQLKIHRLLKENKDGN